MAGEAKLYKYLDVDGGLKMLDNRNLQFTNATRLNDPFDCHPGLINFSNVPIEKTKVWGKDRTIKLESNYYDRLRKETWVCSLSKTYDSLLMWSYYGNHKGVCIGLDMGKTRKHLSRIMCGVNVGTFEMEVQYKDIIDKPDYFHDINDYFGYVLSTKAKAWAHEQEIRLLLINPTPAGPSPHPLYVQMALPYKPKNKKEVIDWKDVRAYALLGGECFESIYLGINMRDEDREGIIAMARRCNPNIAIYQMAIDPEAFRLKEILVEH